MKRKSVLILAIIILIAGIGFKVGYSMYFQWRINLSRGHLWMGDNEIDRLIKKIYIRDSFFDASELENQQSQYEYDEPEVEIGIDQRLRYIDYNNIRYFNEDMRLEQGHIGERIEEIKGYFYDGSGDVSIELFSIQNISCDVAVAARAVNEDSYYVFVNHEYQAGNMETYLKDYGIDMNTAMGYVFLADHKGKYTISYRDVSIKEVSDLISGPDKVLVEDEERSSLDIKQTGLSFWIYNDILKVRHYFNVMGDGYIKVDNPLSNIQFYYCGEDEISKALETMENIRRKYKGILEKTG